MPAPSDKPKTTDASRPTTRGRPQPTAPSENINEARGPRQSTNLNLPAPGTQSKDIPLEPAQADRDQRNAIDRLDTDHDRDEIVVTAGNRANLKPTVPSKRAHQPGREL